MSIKRYDKIKTLMNKWIAGTIITTDALLSKGLSNSDIQKYLSSKWIEQVGHGAYKKYGDLVNWQGAVYGLQNDQHIGGKTSLNLQGMGHFLNLGKMQLHLFSSSYSPLPKWFTSNDWNADIKYFRTKVLPDNLGINDFDCGGFSIKISCPERAALELMQLVNKVYSIDECKLIAENFVFFRPDVMQKLLEQSNSIKTKRLILFFAKYHNLPWFTKMDLSKIELGSGYRKVTEGNLYDPQFMINYQEDFEYDEPKF